MATETAARWAKELGFSTRTANLFVRYEGDFGSFAQLKSHLELDLIQGNGCFANLGFGLLVRSEIRLVVAREQQIELGGSGRQILEFQAATLLAKVSDELEAILKRHSLTLQKFLDLTEERLATLASSESMASDRTWRRKGRPQIWRNEVARLQSVARTVIDFSPPTEDKPITVVRRGRLIFQPTHKFARVLGARISNRQNPTAKSILQLLKAVESIMALQIHDQLKTMQPSLSLEATLSTLRKMVQAGLVTSIDGPFWLGGRWEVRQTQTSWVVLGFSAPVIAVFQREGITTLDELRGRTSANQLDPTALYGYNGSGYRVDEVRLVIDREDAITSSGTADAVWEQPAVTFLLIPRHFHWAIDGTDHPLLSLSAFCRLEERQYRELETDKFWPQLQRPRQAIRRLQQEVIRILGRVPHTT